MSSPLRVLVADDHPATRAGIAMTLEASGMVVCAQASDATAAVEAALRERPDVCLLDIHMPGDGIEAAAKIAVELPETPVVMLTVSRNDGDLFAALKAGAVGYLLKDMDPERLPHALRGVLAGEAALPRSLAARLLREFRERERVPSFGRRRADDLTSREWEVLDCLGEGLATVEIGKRLFISPTTVRRHVGEILHKLQVPDREAAVRLVRERSRNLNAK